MCQSNRSFNIPPGIPRAFDVFSCPGGREFDQLSLLGDGAFDHYSYGVGNLIASFDLMLRVTRIPRGMINHGGTSLDAFKGKDTRFVADWLKSKGLHKLGSVFEGIQEPFVLSSPCKSVVY